MNHAHQYIRAVTAEDGADIAEHLDNAQETDRRKGPYVARSITWYVTDDDLQDALDRNEGTLTEDTLPGTQRAVQIIDSQYGMAYAMIPVDEGDPDSDADFAHILRAINEYDKVITFLQKLEDSDWLPALYDLLDDPENKAEVGKLIKALRVLLP